MRQEFLQVLDWNVRVRKYCSITKTFLLFLLRFFDINTVKPVAVTLFYALAIIL